MAGASLVAPPVLSTPPADCAPHPPAASATPPSSTLSDAELQTTYDVTRTAAEIRARGGTRIALQFPDAMLVDAPRVVESLRAALAADDGAAPAWRLHILADTSYSACCVDEVAAEHADAHLVVHYGRTCLSPTSRLPVIYVYTRHELDHGAALRQFASHFGDTASKVIVMADLTFQDHVGGLVGELRARGYTDVVATDVVRDPAAIIPNRRISGLAEDPDLLRSYSLFHISDPPQSLLLALHSRFASLHVLSTPSPSTSAPASPPSLDDPTLATARLLRRRFARVLSLAAAGVIGILVNTLSVSNYLSSVNVLRDKIARAGKKSYTVVVGKLNPAKLANFAEVEGWVVVGCWESGLIEEDAGYWRPVVTPFEMEVALMSDEERTWGGEWWGGIEKLRLDEPPDADASEQQQERSDDGALAEDGSADGDGVGDEESLPPRFDLRTGKLVTHSQPMRLAVRRRKEGEAQGVSSKGGREGGSGAVATRMAGEVASVKGVASPGAEYLRSKRTWQGLGSDFDEAAASSSGAVMEEGRSGIARGYRVGGGGPRH